MRVHELAKELGVASKDLLASLREMGVDGLTASSSVPDQAVPRLRASGGKAVPEAKIREAVEEPAPKARPKPKKAEAPKPAEPPPAPEAAPKEEVPPPAPAPASEPAPPKPEPRRSGLPTLRLVRGATAQDVADKTDRSPADVVKLLFTMGEMATATQSLADDALSSRRDGARLRGRDRRDRGRGGGRGAGR